MESNAGKGTHGSLNDLGIEAVSRVQGAEDIVHSEPVAGADDGAEVSRVLDSVQSQEKTGFAC